MSLWSDDHPLYMVPGHAVLRGKASIRPLIAHILAQCEAAGGATSEWDLAFDVDPGAGEPAMVSVHGEQVVTMGGERHSAQCLGTMVKEEEEWRFKVVGIVLQGETPLDNLIDRKSMSS